MILPGRHWIALGALMVAVVWGWYARGLVAERDVAQIKAQHAQAVTVAAEQAQAAEQRAREAEARHAAAVEEIANAERQAQAARAAAAASARAAAASMRDAARAATDALVSQAAAAASAASGGETASSTGLVLANVLGSCGERVAWLAEQLDEARARGLACQRAYAEVTTHESSP